MIKVINNPRLCKNFKLDEFTCNCGCKQVFLNVDGVLLLQAIRNHFSDLLKKEVAVTVYSGTRCDEHNEKVGGTTDSFHLLGMAYDIVVDGVHPIDVARYAVSIGFKGVGVYTQNNWFTHIDTRIKATYWKDIKGSKQLNFVDKL